MGMEPEGGNYLFSKHQAFQTRSKSVQDCARRRSRSIWRRGTAATLITDQALRGNRPLSAVSHIVVWQVVGRFAGTLVAQLIFYPAALLVVRLAHLLA